MSLINLKTNLKSLRFGNDVQGGGSSGLPYIQPGLPEDSPAGEYLAGVARNSADWPLRGGTYSTIASTEDTVRVSRFLNDFSRGTVFTSKQIGLQKSNPLIETEQRGSAINTRVYSNSNLLAQVAEQGTGVHIPRAGFNTNDLLQDQNKYESIVTSNNNTGKNRLITLYNSKINLNPNSTDILSDLTKLGISNDENTLFDYVGGPGSSYGDGNTFIGRAVNTNKSWENYKTNKYHIYGYEPRDTITFKNPDKPGIYQQLASNRFNVYLNDIFKSEKTFRLSQGEEIIDVSYDEDLNEISRIGTGKFKTKAETIITPDPSYTTNKLGTGIANIQYQQFSKDFIRPLTQPENVSVNNKFSNTMPYDALLRAKSSTESTEGSLNEIIDFRSLTTDPTDPARSQARSYASASVNITTRVGIGSPGGRLKDQRKYINQVNYSGQDQVNMIPLYADATDPFNGKPEARDLIKFAFEVINNDGATGISEKGINEPVTTKVHFRAFLTNFADNHSADWSGQRYVGRGENFYNYQGFTRDVSFQFKVVAQSKQEMLPLWQKLNYLASSLYPDYNDQGFMRGNLHKLTIGEYFYRTPGILKSMNISVDDNYPWEIKYSEPETARSFEKKDFTGITNQGTKDFIESNSDADMMELPQVVNVSCTFTPILNELPSLSRVTPTTIQKKHMLISDHGIPENFINRLENPASKIPSWNTETARFNPEFFNININTPNS